MKTENNAIIYTSNNCPACTKTKEWLKLRNINYEERNIENPTTAEDMINISGQMTVPVTILNSGIIIGYNQQLLQHYLNE